MLIDSHCHLNHFLKQEIPLILGRAQSKKISLVQTICTKISEFEEILNIVESYENVFASVGIHPNNTNETTTVEELVNLSEHPKVISIGETGLDYYYENSPREIQQKSFIIHIEAARMTDLPLVIHSRDADEDMIKILSEEYAKGKFTAVMHSFASSEKLSDFALSLGFYLSFSGIVTFKNASDIQKIASKTPKNRILIETDSPYLAPVPQRGKKNEPAFVTHVAEKLNKLKNCDDILNITHSNFFNLFTKCKM
ncbi:MAG: TatD family hydrolase [Rickettsiaceae bacterium H1]|nr:TatD family hydrolase [Rickettsiaceae bacterium H1]